LFSCFHVVRQVANVIVWWVLLMCSLRASGNSRGS
jgi:hypothetical protein